jgi:hypothetical protein
MLSEDLAEPAAKSCGLRHVSDSLDFITLIDDLDLFIGSVSHQPLSILASLIDRTALDDFERGYSRAAMVLEDREMGQSQAPTLSS